jgi:predicted RNA-binding Zn-ribbon protein involved in translation (DUF1610 family)
MEPTMGNLIKIISEHDKCDLCEKFKKENPTVVSFMCPVCGEIWVRGLGLRELMIRNERNGTKSN